MMGQVEAQYTDNTTSLPRQGVLFSSELRARANVLESLSAEEKLTRLSCDRESEESLFLAHSIAHGVFSKAKHHNELCPEDRPSISNWLHDKRCQLQEQVGNLRREYTPSVRAVLIRQRAPITHLSGCWLDRVSQPATEPATIVSLLTAHRFKLKGHASIQSSQIQHWRNSMVSQGVDLPPLHASDFFASCDMQSLTASHAAFYLALSYVPATYLPELVGLHVAHYLLSFDSALLGCSPGLDVSEVLQVLDTYLDCCVVSPSGRADSLRCLKGIELAIAYEFEYLNFTKQAASELARQPAVDAVATIIGKHIRFAGKQHQHVRIANKSLMQWFEGDSTEEMYAFLNEFKQSRSLQKNAKGSCKFLDAIKFGGAMFGVFTDEEAKVFYQWIDKIHTAEFTPEYVAPAVSNGTVPRSSVSSPEDTCQCPAMAWEDVVDVSDRELFYRLVNIESYPNTLALIKTKVVTHFSTAKQLFTCGHEGMYTDASWLEWSPERLRERTDSVYWKKLVDPWQRLAEVPDRDLVIFGQKLAALGSLVDGAWLHRIAGAHRFRHRTDEILLSIYIDEMGRGESEKNHILMIKKTLASMDIHLPHIRNEKFKEQTELPDLYDFAIHQLGLSLFPDSFYEEILGYNLGIEMLGLGELRLHEIQKLKKYGFDTIYEEAHLTIDNFSAGHARQSVNAIVFYMDALTQYLTEDEKLKKWERIWTGYASFAWFIETKLVNKISLSPSDNAVEMYI